MVITLRYPCVIKSFRGPENKNKLAFLTTSVRIPRSSLAIEHPYIVARSERAAKRRLRKTLELLISHALLEYIDKENIKVERISLKRIALPVRLPKGCTSYYLNLRLEI